MRRGFALAAVLFALVLLAALAAGGLVAALQDAHAADHAVALARADAAARASLAAAIDAWDPRRLDSLSPGRALALPASAPGFTVTLTARRVGLRLFLLEAKAVSATGVSRTVGEVVRLRAIESRPPAAVRARAVDPALIPFLDGVNQVPSGWNCLPARDTMPALITQPGLPDSVFLQFGDRDWSALRAWALGVQPGGDSLAVRYDPGDVSLAGGRVLGTLVIGGDLTLSSGVEVVGLVFVRGSVVLGPGGGRISGQLVTSQLIAGAGFTPSGPIVAYSSCAGTQAGVARAWPERLPGLQPGVLY